MSLKAFHVVFISLSIVLAFGFGGWLVNDYLKTGQPLQLVWAGLSFLAAIGLMIYEWRFLKKTRDIPYL